MRRILYYSLVCLLWVSVNSCKDDEASQPPTPTFTVDRTSGLYNSTEFTFTIDQVGSNAVSLLPYGTEQLNTAGILVPASSFTNGKATVKVVYTQVGTFNAVVVANNHTGDGLSVKNTVSAPTAITITSNRNGVSDFAFVDSKKNVISTKTVIDTVAHTITVTVPYGTDVTALTSQTTISDFATSDLPATTSYSSPKDFTVTAKNGTSTQKWTVTVNVTPVETDHSFKSAAGTLTSKGAASGRDIPGYVDNTGHVIILYDTVGMGVPTSYYDSVALHLPLNNSFGYAKIGTHKIADKYLVNLTSDQTVTAVAQDSSRVDYKLGFRKAPTVTVSFNDLNPVVSGSNDANFVVNLNVLKGTTIAALKPTLDFGTATIGQIMIDKGASPAINFNAGDTVDFSKPVTFIVPVTDGGVTYNVKYTVTLTVK
jgi:hypothetical protein